MRLHRCSGVITAGVVMGLSGLVAGCGSSHPAPSSAESTAAATAAITSAWTRFFNGATPVAQREAVLQNGASAGSDIRLLFALWPGKFTTKVEAIKLNGSTATVTYEFLDGTSSMSAKPATGTAVLVGGRWLVSHATWAALVSGSDIHGSG